MRRRRQDSEGRHRGAKRQSEAARGKINKWVEDKTREKIKDLLPPGSLNGYTRMVLTNAIYFKGDWASQFKKKDTKDMDFHVSAGKKLKTPMMHQLGKFGYTENGYVQALKMPYVGKDLSMVVLLPKKRAGMAKLARSLTVDHIDLWVKRLGHPRKVNVYFPRFKMTYKMKMKSILAKMGMFCDEIEKALAGSASSGQTDSGVSARLFGALLTWLSDHETDVFFIGTCNDISKLPPEFSRAERFDGVFFLDLPSAAEKDVIWSMYIERFGVETSQKRPSDTDWTGAEIRSCCRLAKLLDVPLIEAAKNVVPVAVTAAEAVDRLRTWASGRCLCSYQPGIYSRQAKAKGRRRRVARDVSTN